MNAFFLIDASNIDISDDMILEVENPKDSTHTHTHTHTTIRIHEYSKVARYKINIQKSVAFLYTNDELPEKEIKNTNPFKILKYSGINLIKEVKIANY